MVGSWLVERLKRCKEFTLREFVQEIGNELKVVVTEDELRQIIGIVMNIKDPCDPEGKIGLLPLVSEVLNPDGSLSGKLALRDGIIHRDGLLHGTSNVAIFKIVDGEVYILLQQRAKNKFIFPDRWTLSACGHIDPGMNSFGAAVKETMEEVSFKKAGLYLNIESIIENFVPVGEELMFDGYLKQYAFEYTSDVTLDEEGIRKEIEGILQLNGLSINKETFESIFLDVNKDKKWIIFYTFNPQNEALLEEIKNVLQSQDVIPVRFDPSPEYSPFNREKKSFYIYVLKTGDPNLEIIDEIVRISQESKNLDPIGGAEVRGFEWVDFDALLQNFKAHPSRYTDAFFPFFSSPNVLEQIRNNFLRSPN